MTEEVAREVSILQEAFGKRPWKLVVSGGRQYLVAGYGDCEGNRIVFDECYVHFDQIQMVFGSTPRRQEALVPIDLVGCVEGVLWADTIIMVDTLPGWRQEELARMLLEAQQQAKAIAAQKRSGLIV